MMNQIIVPCVQNQKKNYIDNEWHGKKEVHSLL